MKPLFVVREFWIRNIFEKHLCAFKNLQLMRKYQIYRCRSERKKLKNWRTDKPTLFGSTIQVFIGRCQLRAIARSKFCKFALSIIVLFTYFYSLSEFEFDFVAFAFDSRYCLSYFLIFLVVSLDFSTWLYCYCGILLLTLSCYCLYF